MKRRQAGFSMLEVLVSLLIILIGVLGMAGIQMLAVNNTGNANDQSLAAILASSLAAEIQGNAAYWAQAPASIAVTGTSVTGGPPSSGANCSNTGNSPVGSPLCTPAQMAYYDLSNWGGSLASALPSGTGAIACTATPLVCTITLGWAAKNVASNNPTGAETGALASGTVGQRTYQTTVTVTQ